MLSRDFVCGLTWETPLSDADESVAAALRWEASRGRSHAVRRRPGPGVGRRPDAGRLLGRLLVEHLLGPVVLSSDERVPRDHGVGGVHRPDRRRRVGRPPDPRDLLRSRRPRSADRAARSRRGTRRATSGTPSSTPFHPRSGCVPTTGRASVPARRRPSPRRTSKDLVADLEMTLDLAGIEGPFLLVGHSMAVLAGERRSPPRTPTDVAGVVLVDPRASWGERRVPALRCRHARDGESEADPGLARGGSRGVRARPQPEPRASAT